MNAIMLTISLPVILCACTPAEVQVGGMVAEETVKVVEDIVQAEEAKSVPVPGASPVKAP